MMMKSQSAALAHRLGLLLPLVLGTLSSCREPRASSPAPSGQARDLLVTLERQIREVGEATVVILAPPRSYQAPVPDEAQRQLAVVLDLPVLSPNRSLPNCRWAPIDSGAIGMAIALTERTVAGDSAIVSVLRTCRQRMRGRDMRYEDERTWILGRSTGGWSVMSSRARTTELRRDGGDTFARRSC